MRKRRARSSTTGRLPAVYSYHRRTRPFGAERCAEGCGKPAPPPRPSENLLRPRFGEGFVRALAWIGLLTPPGTRLILFVAAKITPLEDVPIVANIYAAHAVPTTGRVRRTRRPKMRPPTPNPTEKSLGVFNEREDLLEQVARKSRVAR